MYNYHEIVIRMTACLWGLWHISTRKKTNSNRDEKH